MRSDNELEEYSRGRVYSVEENEDTGEAKLNGRLRLNTENSVKELAHKYKSNMYSGDMGGMAAYATMDSDTEEEEAYVSPTSGKIRKRPSRDEEWEERKTETGRVYFVDKKSGRTTLTEKELAKSLRGQALSDYDKIQAQIDAEAAAKWTEEWDTEKARPFWHNEATKEYTWVNPDADMFNDWEEKWDPQSQRHYWHNNRTRSSTWTSPFVESKIDQPPDRVDEQINEVDKRLLCYFFYEKHNPLKTSTLPDILEDYRDSEEVLMNSLLQKYRLEKAEWLDIIKTIKRNPNRAKAAMSLLGIPDPDQPVEPELVPDSDWVERWDTASQRPYWSNQKTGESSWVCPNPVSSWEEKYDAKTLKSYWESTKTKRLTWTNPNPVTSAAPLNLQSLEAHNKAIDDKVQQALFMNERAQLTGSPTHDDRPMSPREMGLPPPPPPPPAPPGPPPPPEDDEVGGGRHYTESVISSVLTSGDGSRYSPSQYDHLSARDKARQLKREKLWEGMTRQKRNTIVSSSGRRSRTFSEAASQRHSTGEQANDPLHSYFHQGHTAEHIPDLERPSAHKMKRMSLLYEGKERDVDNAPVKYDNRNLDFGEDGSLSFAKYASVAALPPPSPPPMSPQGDAGDSFTTDGFNESMNIDETPQKQNRNKDNMSLGAYFSAKKNPTLEAEFLEAPVPINPFEKLEEKLVERKNEYTRLRTILDNKTAKNAALLENLLFKIYKLNQAPQDEVHVNAVKDQGLVEKEGLEKFNAEGKVKKAGQTRSAIKQRRRSSAKLQMRKDEQEAKEKKDKRFRPDVVQEQAKKRRSLSGRTHTPDVTHQKSPTNSGGPEPFTKHWSAQPAPWEKGGADYHPNDPPPDYDDRFIRPRFFNEGKGLTKEQLERRINKYRGNGSWAGREPKGRGMSYFDNMESLDNIFSFEKRKRERLESDILSVDKSEIEHALEMGKKLYEEEFGEGSKYGKSLFLVETLQNADKAVSKAIKERLKAAKKREKEEREARIHQRDRLDSYYHATSPQHFENTTTKTWVEKKRGEDLVMLELAKKNQKYRSKVEQQQKEEEEERATTMSKKRPPPPPRPSAKSILKTPEQRGKKRNSVVWGAGLKDGVDSDAASKWAGQPPPPPPPPPRSPTERIAAKYGGKPPPPPKRDGGSNPHSPKGSISNPLRSEKERDKVRDERRAREKARDMGESDPVVVSVRPSQVRASSRMSMPPKTPPPPPKTPPPSDIYSRSNLKPAREVKAKAAAPAGTKPPEAPAPPPAWKKGKGKKGSKEPKVKLTKLEQAKVRVAGGNFKPPPPPRRKKKAGVAGISGGPGGPPPGPPPKTDSPSKKTARVDRPPPKPVTLISKLGKAPPGPPPPPKNLPSKVTPLRPKPTIPSRKVSGGPPSGPPPKENKIVGGGVEPVIAKPPVKPKVGGTGGPPTSKPPGGPKGAPTGGPPGSGKVRRSLPPGSAPPPPSGPPPRVRRMSVGVPKPGTGRVRVSFTGGEKSVSFKK
ncbi:hypothetical protein TrLO_g6384 [Triparma laevis f. longispina]|nr:hypothetical protein TrLO_g6384 [Triparma laevis f. longispina]